MPITRLLVLTLYILSTSITWSVLTPVACIQPPFCSRASTGQPRYSVLYSSPVIRQPCRLLQCGSRWNVLRRRPVSHRSRCTRLLQMKACLTKYKTGVGRCFGKNVNVTIWETSATILTSPGYTAMSNWCTRIIIRWILLLILLNDI